MITTTFRSPPVCSSQLSSSSHLSHGSLLSAAVFSLGQTGNVCCLKLHHHCSSTTAAAPTSAANVDHHLHRTGHSLGGLPPPPHVLPGRAAPEPAESTSESAASTAAGSVPSTVQWRWRPWCEPGKSAADEQLCGVDGRRTAAAAATSAPTAASASNQHSADLSADSSSLQH